MPRHVQHEQEVEGTGGEASVVGELKLVKVESRGMRPFRSDLARQSGLAAFVIGGSGDCLSDKSLLAASR